MTEGQVSLQTLLEPGRTISYGILKTGLFVEAGVPTVQGGSIRNFTVKRSELKTVSESLSNEFSRTILRGGEILVAIRGTVGNVAVANADLIGCNVSREVAVIPIRQGVDEQYVMHMLATRDGQNQIRGYIKGIAQSGINLEDLRRCKVPLPPLEEQRRIAAILVQADALRDKRRQALALVEQLTQSVFLDMFGGKYPVSRISDVCVVKGGKRLPKGSDYSERETPYRYIRVSDMSEGKIDVLALRYLLPEIQAKIARYTVADGDVVISIAGTIGVVAVIDSELDGANLTENAAKISPRSIGVYDPVYLTWALRSPAVQNQIAQRTGQVTIGKLALFRIEGIEFPLPPLELQQEFARRVEAIEKLKAAHQRSLQEMDALFASLQHRAFRGEL